MTVVMMKVINHHHIVTATEKMTVPQLDKKFPTFYEIQKFVTFTTAQQ
jgi:hypothetical protein